MQPIRSAVHTGGTDQSAPHDKWPVHCSHLPDSRRQDADRDSRQNICCRCCVVLCVWVYTRLPTLHVRE